MFTGIVEETGRIRTIEPFEGGARFVIDAAVVLEDASLGASIALNGCCLTVVELGEGHWAADAVIETMARTTLGDLSVGDPVNLERPVRLADRLGGHIVTGHIDGVGIITELSREADGSARIVVAIPSELARYVVEKGSIAIDGISLTVARVGDPIGGEATVAVTIAVIPHTQAVTTLGHRGVGSRLNIEVDTLAKYVERLLVGTSLTTVALALDRPSERN